MSVIVKGMEMPNTCDECLINCGHSMLYIGITDRRSPNCQLVELPPHGNLKDESDIISLIEVMFCKDKDGMEHAIQCVKDAPTVIEAEGETE